MSSGIYSALSGAVAQERNLNVIANNVANATTTGYRADATAFNKVLAQQTQAEPQRNASYAYSQLTRVQVDMSAGALRRTGRPLDFAILGDGFFTLQTPDGERLTRDGSFVMDAAGKVMTQDGHPLLMEGNDEKPEGLELVIPRNAREILLSQDGSVQADGISLGRLRMRAFQGPLDVTKSGDNLFAAAPGATLVKPDELNLVQASLETSNLNAVHGLNQMIVTNRAFDALQKIIRTFQDIEQKTARGMGQ